MTWHTPSGNRVLFGAEAELVREALSILVDQFADCVEENDGELDVITGVATFDSLPVTAKIATCQAVANALFSETAEPLQLSAVNESTVLALFQTLLSEIEMEIECQDDWSDDEPDYRYYWRSLALRAFRERRKEDDEAESGSFVPSDPKCTAMESWEFVIECLADGILWDRDFEMADSFLDTPPDPSKMKKQLLGIDAGYFTAIAPDLDRNQVDATLRSLRELTQHKPR